MSFLFYFFKFQVKSLYKNVGMGTSLAVQCLRPRTSTAGGTASIPGQGTKIPHAAQRGQKKKKKN